MSEKKEAINHAQRALNSVEALIYQRNQAYAFITMQGLALNFFTFIEEKQCEQTTDEELRMLLEVYTPKKKRTKK